MSSVFLSSIDKLKKTKGYLIDIRENGGGNSGNADVIASTFINGSFMRLNTLHPIHIGVYKAWAEGSGFSDEDYDDLVKKRGYSDWLEKTFKIPKHLYFEELSSSFPETPNSGLLTGPLVILTSPKTASAAENLLVVLDYAKRATIVGQASYGSTGMPLMIDLESGGGVNICTRQSYYPDRREFINIGIAPHIECHLTVKDYEMNIDSVMDKGIETLRKLVNK